MRPYDEAKAQQSGKSGGSFYAEDLVLATEQRRLRDASHIIRAEDQVWEDSPHGRLRHIAHPKLNPHVHDIDAYIQELAPDGRSGKHRHMAEEFIFFLEGRGYSLHWDVELVEMGETFHWGVSDVPKRFEWEATDWMYIPVNTVHQHFNLDGDEPARFLSATSRVYKFLGCHDLEQIEPAPTRSPA
jgi:quercetin dioxygenase-like cupin family protein